LCLLATCIIRDLAPDLGRAVLGLRAWYGVRELPGEPLQAGHFHVWVMLSSRGKDDPMRRGAGGGGIPSGTAVRLDQQVVEQLERAYARVTADLGVQPRGPVPVVLHPDLVSLEEYAGGAAARASSGVYSGGIIHLLYRGDLSGPLAHELTHYLLGLVAPDRVPRWFQEGLAQLEEWRLTGDVLYDPDRAPLLPWPRLEREFPRLPDDTAYGASISAVSFLYHEGGDQALRLLISELAAGTSFPDAVRLAWGRSLADLEQEWMARGEGVAGGAEGPDR